MLNADEDFNNRNLADDEKVIEKTIDYLKYNDPANANREYAIGLLKRMQSVARAKADGSKLDFEEFVEQDNQSQKKD